MSLNKFHIVFCFFLITALLKTVYVYPQKSRDELEKEKQANLQKIKEAQAILEQTQSQQKSSVGRLNAINKQIEARKDLVLSMQKEIAFINNQISVSTNVIESMEEDLMRLKNEYGNMIYNSYKSSNSFNKLTFLFSSNSFNQFVMRLKYLEQYSEARKDQVRMINEVKEGLNVGKADLEKNKGEKTMLLNEQIAEQKKLAGLYSKQNDELSSLKKQEKNLKTELAKRQKDVEKLEKLIASLVEKEINAANAANSKLDLSKLSSLFEKNKAKLPWPVSTGFISGHFGTQQHPVLKKVMVNNIGVIIQTKEQEKVKAVFDGKVTKVAIVPGEMKNVVLLQHGEYFTVYTRLKEVYVKKGQTIKTNEIIGVVNTDVNGNSELEFQVWKKFEKLDPETWLVKK